MSERIAALAGKVDTQLKASVRRLPSLAHELAYEVEPAALLTVCRTLRDTEGLKFEMLMDLAGVDYLHHGQDDWQTLSATRSGFSRAAFPESAAPDPGAPGRFAVIYNLLSIAHNQRLRLKAICPDTAEPVLDSVVEVWASANWFEREAFDCSGFSSAGIPTCAASLPITASSGTPSARTSR